MNRSIISALAARRRTQERGRLIIAERPSRMSEARRAALREAVDEEQLAREDEMEAEAERRHNNSLRCPR